MNRTGLVWGIALLLASCAAQPPQMIDITVDAGNDEEEDPNATGSGTRTDGGTPGMVLPPTASAPATTMWLTVPVRGRGPINGQVLLRSMAAGSLTVLTDRDGQFCRDVPLEKGSLNTITLQSQDEEGTLSSTTELQVQQSGEPPSDPPGSESQNIAPGGKPGTNEHPAWGQVNNMIDGDPSSALVLQAPPFYSGWVWIDLRARSKVNLIRVRSIPDCPLKHYAVFVSNADGPGDPPGNTSGSSANWIKVGEVTRGTGDDTIQFEGRMARTMSIRFLDQDCGLFSAEQHKIGEVEVWTEEAPTSAGQRAPTCFDN